MGPPARLARRVPARIVRVRRPPPPVDVEFCRGYKEVDAQRVALGRAAPGGRLHAVEARLVDDDARGRPERGCVVRVTPARRRLLLAVRSPGGGRAPTT